MFKSLFGKKSEPEKVQRPPGPPTKVRGQGGSERDVSTADRITTDARGRDAPWGPKPLPPTSVPRPAAAVDSGDMFGYANVQVVTGRAHQATET